MKGPGCPKGELEFSRWSFEQLLLSRDWVFALIPASICTAHACGIHVNHILRINQLRNKGKLLMSSRLGTRGTGIPEMFIHVLNKNLLEMKFF